MSNLVFISADFCSGSTLMFTLFRKTGQYYCLYEPLHPRLLEYLYYPLRAYEHHFFVDSYFTEYRGFKKIPVLFDPDWGVRRLFLPADANADDLYRYLSYLVGTAFGRSEKVLLKFNRATFRLGWLRAEFPQAKIVHIYRNREEQWNSVVRRGQRYLGREDIGQNDVMFQGFNIAAWCEDLQATFPELDARNSKTGYERFSKLWQLSLAENQRYADVSVDYKDLTHDFGTNCGKIWEAVGCDAEIEPLEKYVVPQENQRTMPIFENSWNKRILGVIDRAGRKYAKVRVRLNHGKTV